ncbi:SDR family oxidoreductase [Longimicrobium sp.]|uniref:SDR family oxidoreductase n=1 Tax=Longimicrobium sp. TaxID=2029185 RepID=UPI002CCEE928|nr:SDR family oxidoreductase [Longimicrobium sp.]HSU15467.1 SDR family oxidoreductase [Longimicrobium sp.]
MTGRVCVVTGASGGIGKAAATELARRGATVALVVRSPERGEAARAEIERATGNGAARVVLADLSRQAEVRRAADELLSAYPRIDVLVNNAAVYTRRRRLTDDGIEMQWAVNHLAPFLLTSLLLPRLTASAPARVVTVSSNAHEMAELRWDDLEMRRRRYRGFRQYGNTKRANVLFTRELARRTAGSGVAANALHPGTVATELLMNGFPPIRLFRRWLRTPEQGAATAVYLAASPEVAGISGEYFVDERPVPVPAPAHDDEAARRLWEISERMVGLA